MNLAGVLYRKGDMAHTQRAMDEAMSLKLPISTSGAVSLDAARIYAELGDASAIKLLEKSIAIARKVTSWDHATIQADLGFCYIRGTRVFLDLGDTDNALEQIELADSVVSNKFMRRRCVIQALQANIYIAKGMYHDALVYAESALALARDLGASENLIKGQILNLAHLLQASPFGTSREVKLFAGKVSLFIGNKSIKPASC